MKFKKRNDEKKKVLWMVNAWTVPSFFKENRYGWHKIDFHVHFFLVQGFATLQKKQILGQSELSGFT